MPDQKRLTPEMLVPRMGEYLVQKGLVSEDGIQKALAYQQQETARGNSHPAGAGFDRSEFDQTAPTWTRL